MQLFGVVLEPRVCDTHLVLSEGPQLKDGSQVGCHEGGCLGSQQAFFLIRN